MLKEAFSNIRKHEEGSNGVTTGKRIKRTTCSATCCASSPLPLVGVIATQNGSYSKWEDTPLVLAAPSPPQLCH